MNANDLKSRPGFKRIVKALQYSIRGLVAAWTHEAAFRQEVFAAVVLTGLAAWLSRSVSDFAVLLASLLLVLLIELLNSAIEALADAITLDMHPLIQRAKDLGSAAVLAGMGIAALVWLAVLL